MTSTRKKNNIYTTTKAQVKTKNNTTHNEETNSIRSLPNINMIIYIDEKMIHGDIKIVSDKLMNRNSFNSDPKFEALRSIYDPLSIVKKFR